MMDAVLDRAGVVGGVRGSFGSRCEASDRLRDGDCSEDEREGGALLTAGLDTEVVGFRSCHFLVMDGQRRLCRLKEPPVEASPDFRRLKKGPSVNPEKLNWSSP